MNRLPPNPNWPRSALGMLRIHQWVKNLLILIPALLSRQLSALPMLCDCGLAILCFGLIASAGYTINDCLDIASDQDHPTKRHRPIPSGDISIKSALLIAAIFVCLALSFAFTWLPTGFGLCLFGYLILSITYSVWLKQLMVIDVLTLAFLYSLRIFAGGQASGVLVSDWLIVFSMFMFTSLAFAKRSVELNSCGELENYVTRRPYSDKDTHIVETIGVSTGLVSVLVLAMYIKGSEVQLVYEFPQLLWVVCFLLLFWISRLWLLVARGEIHHDPVVFALRDVQSVVIAVFVGTLLFLA